MAALIEAATGKTPLYIGKPNPLMMRSALNYLGVHSEDSYMIGDNMRTDILAGISAGMDTVLVLTGITQESDISDFPYRPKFVYNSVREIKMEDLD
jgi:NagD protein